MLHSHLTVNDARPAVGFELLNSTQIGFQCWVELRGINSTQSSWVKLSTQPSQPDGLTRTRLQAYFLPNSLSNSLSKWSNSLSNFLSNPLPCFLPYFPPYFSLYSSLYSLSYSLLHFLPYSSSYFHHIPHYIPYHISHQPLYQIPYQIDCKIDCKKKIFGKKGKSILFLVHSILYLVTKIGFKQFNSISGWARVERDQPNLNSNSGLGWVDFPQPNPILIRRQA